MWGDRGAMPKPAYDELRSSVQGARVLAWGSGPDGLIAGLPVGMAFESQGWQVLGWHDIAQGTWDSETGVLGWHTNDGDVGTARLDKPGKLPPLMKDRVAASIVIEDRLSVRGVKVIITARRNLGMPDSALVWRAVTADGRTLDRPGLRNAVESRIAELRDELPLSES